MSGINATGAGDALLAGGTATAPQTFTGFNEFDELTKYNIIRPQLVADGTTANPTDYDFITKTDGNALYGSITNNALLDGGVSIGEPQTFTGFNEFDNTTTFNRIDISATGATSILKMTAADNNLIEQEQTAVTSYQGNEIYQHGGTVNKIFQKATGTYFNHILQEGTNSLIETAGIVQATTVQAGIAQIGAGTFPSPPSYKLQVLGTVSLEGGGGAYVRVTGTNMSVTGGSSSYLMFGNGGHHIDTYSANGAGRRFYINYYNNQGVTLTRFAITSDDRIKEDEKFIENATDTLLKLRPQTYIKYAPIPDGSSIKPNFDLSGNFESGLIAQEIYYDAPELRHIVEIEDDKGDKIIPSSDDPQKDPDYSDWGDMPAGVDYIQLIPYLIKSNQELHQRISILEAKINEL